MKRRPPKIWTEEQKMILKKLYQDSTMQEIIAALDNEFNAHQIMHKAQKMGIKKSAAFKKRFGLDENGRLNGKVAPHNKGKSMPSRGRASDFHFKPRNILPVGTIRYEKDGYMKIKVSDPDKWELLHRVVWERENGAYPPNDCAIIFIDGNKRNCDISNLKMVTRAELMLQNSMQNYPEELKKVINLQAAIRRKINAKQ